MADYIKMIKHLQVGVETTPGTPVLASGRGGFVNRGSVADRLAEMGVSMANGTVNITNKTLTMDATYLVPNEHVAEVRELLQQAYGRAYEPDINPIDNG